MADALRRIAVLDGIGWRVDRAHDTARLVANRDAAPELFREHALDHDRAEPLARGWRDGRTAALLPAHAEMRSRHIPVDDHAAAVDGQRSVLDGIGAELVDCHR